MAKKATTPSLIAARSAAEIKSLKRQLAAAHRHNQRLADTLDKARAARAPRKPPAAKTHRRRRGDIVRVVCGDLHGSKQDDIAVSRLLGDLKTIDPDEIILGGDMTDCGGFLAQHHTLGYVAETDYTYEDDLAQANTFLDLLAKAAPRARIEYIEGNHEARVERWAITQALKDKIDATWLIDQVSPQKHLRLAERGIPYHKRSERHDGLKIPGWIRRGKIYFTHEISSAKNAAAAALAATGGNIVYFHTHRADTFRTYLPHVGNVSAWSPGCLCERQPLWRHTRPTYWTHGYDIHLVQKSGNFLAIHVPIVSGESLLTQLLNR